MFRRLVPVCLGFILLVGVGPLAPAATPLGGLAVAVSPDGTQLVVGGDSRAFYVLDPTSLAVTRRVHLGRAIVDLAFAPDGKHLAVESTKAVQIVDATTWEVVQTHEDFERMSVAADAGLVASVSRRPAAIQILSMTDGSIKAAIPYDSMQTVASFGLSPDGSKLALLYYRKSSETEPKVASGDIPKELKGAARKAFQQEHDGYTGQFLVFDVATGKATLDKTLWFSASGGGSRTVWRGADAFVIGYDNQNAKITADGTVTYFELGNSYNYGWSPSPDGGVILSGGLRSGTRTPTATLEGVAFELDALPGFPEYWKSFSFARDGTGFGGTSCWRVARIDAAGKIVKVAPVH